MSFLDSKFLSDLGEGKLPKVEVSVEVKPETLVNIFVGAFLIGLALQVVNQIFLRINR